MEPMNLRIGEKLKSIRMVRTLSLDDAAALTGVSKPMLGQIERGQSVPTVTTLWKIATGLKTPLSAFLEEPQMEYTVTGLDEANVVLGDGGKMRAYIRCSPMTRCGAWRHSTLSLTRSAAIPRTSTMRVWRNTSLSCGGRCGSSWGTGRWRSARDRPSASEPTFPTPIRT